MITQLIPSFNGGEFSPLVHRRTDLEKYRSGCKVLKNMLISPYGGVRKRPGLEFLGGTKGSGRARLVRFQYSTELSYMLELGAGYLRVWNRDGTPVVVVAQELEAANVEDLRNFQRDSYVKVGGVIYRCLEDHVESGSFALDLAAEKWVAWTGPLEFKVPYAEGELREVQYVQINAVMYFTHPRHAPQKFRLDPGPAGYFREVEWSYPALLDENLDEEFTIETEFDAANEPAAWVVNKDYMVGMRVSHAGKNYRANRKHKSAAGKTPDVATFKKLVFSPSRGWYHVQQKLWTEFQGEHAAAAGQEVTLLASREIFTANHVGAFFEIAMPRALNAYEAMLKVAAEDVTKESGTLVIQGRWQFSTYGNWNGTFVLHRSRDAGKSWEPIRSWESSGDRNVSAQGSEPGRCLMKITWKKETDVVSVVGKPRAVLEAADGYIRGIVKILTVGRADVTPAPGAEYTDGMVARAVCVMPVEEGKTSHWSEGAWSKQRGFPRTVAVHEQRVIYGGTERRSQDVWGSATDDYENFKRGTEETDAWTHSLAADQQNSIQWLLSQKQLLIGTSGGEWVLGSTREEAGISATNVRARRHSGHGSEYLPATLVNEATLFVQRGGRKLREMVFSFEADGYVTQDLTILADHVTDGGVVDTAFQQQRDAVLWAVVSSGELIALTYERGQKVGGWGRHGTAGKFESVAVLATPGEEDEVWVIVSRMTGGVEKRYVERFRPDQFRAQAESDLKELFYVDAGVVERALDPELAPVTGVSGLSHLEGKVVEVIADGHVLARRTVADGMVALGGKPGDPEEATVIIVGLPYEAVLEPLPLEIGMQDGTSAGRTKRIYEVDIFLHQSGGCLIGDRVGGRFDVMSMREVGAPLGVAVPLFTGIKTHKLDARGEREASFVIRQESPVPLSVLGVVPKWSVNGS